MVQLTPGGELNFIGCLVMLGTSSIFVSLGSCVQIRSKQCVMIADWFCFLSLLIFIGHCAYILAHILTVPVQGEFATIPTGSPEEAQSFKKLTFACSLLFINGVTLAKLSILAGYRTIFAIQRQYRHIVMGLAALCIVWWACFILVTVFQCNPTQAMWTTRDSTHCLSVWKPILAAEISNLVIDVMIIVTPILAICRLQLSSPKKWAVAGIFLMGVSVCTASILQIEAIGHFGNEYHDPSKVVFYLTIQFGLAIICGSLFPLKGLFFGQQKSTSLSGINGYDGTFRESHISIPAYKLAGQLKKSKRERSRVLSIARSWVGLEARQSEAPIRPPPAVRINC